jgi:hypothetical protein
MPLILLPTRGHEVWATRAHPSLLVQERTPRVATPGPHIFILKIHHGFQNLDRREGCKVPSQSFFLITLLYNSMYLDEH